MTTRKEEVILDVNDVARGHVFCHVESHVVSLSGRLLAYAVDTVGRREYAIRVRGSHNRGRSH